MTIEISPSTLRPLPLRITQRQYLRLTYHRQVDQLSIQEHVRRALDMYLDDLDGKRPREILPNQNKPDQNKPPKAVPKKPQASQVPPQAPAEKPRPKLAMR